MVRTRRFTRRRHTQRELADLGYARAEATAQPESARNAHWVFGVERERDMFRITGPIHSLSRSARHTTIRKAHEFTSTRSLIDLI